MEKKYLSVSDIDCYKTAFKLSNQVWDIVNSWSNFEKDTIGRQLVRSIDSISANIAEGFGRFTKKDKIRFYQISKGSLQESMDWLNKTRVRKIITIEEFDRINGSLNDLPKQINQLIKYTNIALKD